jgi:hypothetical protein
VGVIANQSGTDIQRDSTHLIDGTVPTFEAFEGSACVGQSLRGWGKHRYYCLYAIVPIYCRNHLRVTQIWPD